MMKLEIPAGGAKEFSLPHCLKIKMPPCRMAGGIQGF